MYFEIGKYLSEKVKSEDWGSKAIDKLVLTIKSQYPYLKGFNRAGLYRMIQFYETYRDNIIVSPLLTQLSWTNNLMILQGTKTIEEKEFYIRLCIKNNHSKRELHRQIQSHYYERFLLSNGNALESLHSNEVVDMYIDNQGSTFPTTNAIIVTSKTGSHMYPAKPDGFKKD